MKNNPRLSRLIPHHRKLRIDYYPDNFKINIDTEYPIEREMISGTYDKETQDIIRKFVKEKDYCVDVGANIGAISLSMAKKVGPKGKVFSFEPGDLQIRRFKNNLNLNSDLYKNIIILNNIGLADKETKLSLYQDKTNKGNAGFINSDIENSTKIKCSTLDIYLEKNRIKKLDFIKIDVEGIELEVMKGSLKTIRKYRPLIYYETRLEFKKIRNRKILLEIDRILTTLNYKLFYLKKDKLIKTKYPEYKSNTLAIPKEKINCFKGKLKILNKK